MVTANEKTSKCLLCYFGGQLALGLLTWGAVSNRAGNNGSYQEGMNAIRRGGGEIMQKSHPRPTPWWAPMCTALTDQYAAFSQITNKDKDPPPTFGQYARIWIADDVCSSARCDI